MEPLQPQTGASPPDAVYTLLDATSVNDRMSGEHNCLVLAGAFKADGEPVREAVLPNPLCFRPFVTSTTAGTVGELLNELSSRSSAHSGVQAEPSAPTTTKRGCGAAPRSRCVTSRDGSAMLGCRR